MLGKILFTAAIIFAVFALVRFKQTRQSAEEAPRVVNAVAEKKRFPIGWMASVAVVLMLLASGLLLLSSWKDANEIVSIRVVDASSGKAVQYQAYRSDIDGRSFRTVEGIRVTLAETERLETSINR